MAQTQHGVVSSIAEVAELISDTVVTVAFSLRDGRFVESYGDMRTEALRETLVVVVVEAGPADCTRTPSDATTHHMKTLHISIFYGYLGQKLVDFNNC